MTELSGQERGYVPPDHTSTSEFAIPQPTDDVPGGGPGTAQGGPGDLAEATVVDRPVVPAQGGPADTAAQAPGPSATVTDFASAPSTVTDETFVDPPPEPEPEPVEDTAVDSEGGAGGAPVKGALPLPPLDLEEQASRLRTSGPAEADETSEPPEWPEPSERSGSQAGSGAGAEGEDEPQSVVVAAAAPPKESPKVAVFKPAEPGEWTQRYGAEDDGDVPVAGPRREAPPAGGEPAGQGEWTERFGAEGPEGAPAAAYRQEAPPAAAKPAGSESPAPSASASPAPAVPSASAEDPASPAQSPSVGLPPGTPVGPAAPARPAAQDRPRRPAFLAAVIAAVLVIGVGAIVAALRADRGGPGDEPAARPASPGTPAVSASAAPPSPGITATPEPGATTGAPEPPQGQDPGQDPGGDPGQEPGGTAPGRGAPPAGPVRQGDGVTYQLVQHDPGYYEGRFVITNRTGRPLTDWTITFQVPGGNVKNVWGGLLVRGGSSVEIRNLVNARPIPPGATWEVQFGAEGAATDPRLCRVNGRPCGF